MPKTSKNSFEEDFHYIYEEDPRETIKSQNRNRKLHALLDYCERENSLNNRVKKQKIDANDFEIPIYDIRDEDETMESDISGTSRSSNLKELIELASKELRSFENDSEDIYEEDEFEPPKSPMKNNADTIELLREASRDEFKKIKREEIEEKKKIIKHMPSSQDAVYSAESDLKSFNDFDESMFKFNENTKKYKCPHPDCDKEFPSLSRIKRHFIIHTDIKPFKCENPECDKTFSRKDNMLQHSRVHCPYNLRKRRE